MDISSMIDTNCILFDSTIQLKKDLFSRLATILEKSGYISSKKRFIKDLEKERKSLQLELKMDLAYHMQKVKQ